VYFFSVLALFLCLTAFFLFFCQAGSVKIDGRAVDTYMHTYTHTSTRSWAGLSSVSHICFFSLLQTLLGVPLRRGSSSKLVEGEKEALLSIYIYICVYIYIHIYMCLTVRLLLLCIQAGSVKIDGRDVRELDLDSVMREPHLKGALQLLINRHR